MMEDHEAGRGAVVFTLTVEVFEDGSTRSRSEQPSDAFWEIRKAMVRARNQLDDDIRNGPRTCPFSPVGKGREGWSTWPR